MRKKWVLKRIPADYAGLAEEFGLDPVVIRVLVNRGLTTKEGIREFFDSSDALFDNAAGLCYNVLLWSNAPKQLKGKFQWTRIRFVIFV